MVIVTSLLAGFLMESCEKEPEVAKVTGITFTNVTNGKKTMSVGDEFEIKYAIYPEELQETAELEWSSSDKNVVKVNRRGKVTAEGSGEATITATCGEVTASVLVKVEVVQIETIEFPQEIEVSLGTTVKVEFSSITPANGSLTTLDWEIETYDDGDATFYIEDESLYVTGTKVGFADLVAFKDGEVLNRCEIIVTEYIPVESVEVSLSKQSIEFGDSLTVEATILPTNASVQEAVITCTPADLATVSGNTITALQKEGKVTVYAEADGVTGTAEFEVVAPALQLELSFEGEEDNSYGFMSPDGSVGEYPASITFTLKTNYEADLSKVEWTSSNPSAITISSEGVATAVGHGWADVSAEMDGVKVEKRLRSLRKSGFEVRARDYSSKAEVTKIQTPKKYYDVELYDPAFADDESAMDRLIYLEHYKLSASATGSFTASVWDNTVEVRTSTAGDGTVTISAIGGGSLTLPVSMKITSLTFIGDDSGKNYGTVQKDGSLTIQNVDTDNKDGSAYFESINVMCNCGASYDADTSCATLYEWKSDKVSYNPFYNGDRIDSRVEGTHTITLTEFDPSFSITLTVEKIYKP